jgi:hypothetical protein
LTLRLLMKRVAILTIILIALAITGISWAQTFPGPSSPAMARIYFYRTVETNQVTRWTSVWLNDAKLGDLGERSYFYRDVQPGTYKVGVSSDVPYPDQYQTVTAPAGSTTFIRVFNVPGYGIQFKPGGRYGAPQMYAPSVFGNRMVDPVTAERDMVGLAPTGK